MAEVFESVIEVKTGNSEQTVKGLKKEISDLRDAILNLEKGSDQYNEAVEKLQSDQRKLNEVMALTKKEATALEGSYDALVHQMAQLKKEWRATNDEAKRNELGKQIDSINSQLKELDASIGNHQRNVGNYTESIIDAFESLSQEISHYEDSLYKMEKGTAEYAETFDKLAEAKRRQKQFDMEVDAASMDMATAFDTAAQAGAALASGFGAIQGAMALCGADTEKLTEQMAKLQAVMAIVQGAQGIGAFAKSLKALGVAVKTFTGISMGWIAVIMAVVTAIGVLISKLPMVKEKQEKWENQVKSSAEAQEKFNKHLEDSNTATDRKVRLLKAQGVEEDKIIKYQIEQAKLREQEAKDNYDLANKKYKSALNNADQMSNGAFKSVYGEDKDTVLAKYKEELDAAKATYEQMSAFVAEYEFELELYNEKELTAQRKKNEEKIKEQKETFEKLLQQAQEYSMQLAEEEINAEYEASLQIKEENKPEKDTYTKADEAKAAIAAKELTLRRELNKTLLLEEEERLRKEYELNLQFNEKKLELLKNALNDTKLDAQERANLMVEIANLEVQIETQKYQELKRLRDKDNKEEKERVDKKKENTQKILEVTQAGLDATAQILNKVAEGYEQDGEITEEEAKKLKAIRYSTTIIDMMQGMLTAVSTAMQLGPIAGPIVGAINAAAVAATGAMSLAEIKKQDFSTMNNAPIATTSVTPSSSAYSSVPFDAVRNITGVQETEQLNQATKVYVLESDISNAMNKAHIRENEASF